MELKLKNILLTLVLSLLSISMHGQELWNLEKCINYAWENNLQIKQKKINVEQSENNLDQSKLNYIPSFSASVSHNMNWGRSVDLNDLQIINKFSQSTSASLGASIALIDGLSKINTIKKNKVALTISMEEVASLQNEISISITKSFLQVLLAKEIFRTSQENFKSIASQRDRTEKLVNAGKQAYSTLLEIEAQLANERVQMVNAANQISITKLTLLQLLDLPYSDTFDITTSGKEQIIGNYLSESIDSLYNISLSLPQIKTAELSLQKSKYDLTIAKGKFYPRLSLSASYGSYFSSNIEKDFFRQIDENRNPSIGLGLSIPIFNNREIATSVKNAKLSVKSQEIELKNRQNNLYKEIQKAVTDANGYYENLKATKTNLTAIEESFKYVEQKFEVGSLNGTDYTVSKTNLFKAQSQYYQAKYQFIFQLKIIDFYRGVPISL